jgi:hypothetical protein
MGQGGPADYPALMLQYIPYDFLSVLFLRTIAVACGLKLYHKACIEKAKIYDITGF